MKIFICKVSLALHRYVKNFFVKRKSEKIFPRGVRDFSVIEEQPVHKDKRGQYMYIISISFLLVYFCS